MKKEIKWGLFGAAYLLLGFIILPAVLSLLGVNLIKAAVYFFIYPVWIGIGLIFLLLFTKTKHYWIRGGIIGAIIPLLFLLLASFLNIYFNFLFFNGIEGILAGWLLYAVIGAAIGFAVGKHKEKQKYFFLSK